MDHGIAAARSNGAGWAGGRREILAPLGVCGNRRRGRGVLKCLSNLVTSSQQSVSKIAPNSS
eukprot:1011624-Pyramimonas_sp.AAC.1